MTRRPATRPVFLTPEDWDVWCHAKGTKPTNTWLELIDRYEAADRADADRMLALGCSWAQLRNYIAPPHLAPSDAAIARLTWLLQRGYGSALGVRRSDIACFA